MMMTKCSNSNESRREAKAMQGKAKEACNEQQATAVSKSRCEQQVAKWRRHEHRQSNNQNAGASISSSSSSGWST